MKVYLTIKPNTSLAPQPLLTKKLTTYVVKDDALVVDMSMDIPVSEDGLDEAREQYKDCANVQLVEL